MIESIMVVVVTVTVTVTVTVGHVVIQCSLLTS